jgi:hypothetical protein
MSEEIRLSLDIVTKIDISNAHMVERLVVTFSHCYETIFFWLAHCVLPDETVQYSSRLVASAWNLCENPHVVGFSGTNDTYLLLPARIKRHVPDASAGLSELMQVATNGKMVDLLLRCENVIEDSVAVVGWRSVLDLAVKIGAKALIDCGALLAGADT